MPISSRDDLELQIFIIDILMDGWVYTYSFGIDSK